MRITDNLVKSRGAYTITGHFLEQILVCQDTRSLPMLSRQSIYDIHLHECDSPTCIYLSVGLVRTITAFLVYFNTNINKS